MDNKYERHNRRKYIMDNKYERHNRHKYSLKVPIVLVTKYRKQ